MECICRKGKKFIDDKEKLIINIKRKSKSGLKN